MRTFVGIDFSDEIKAQVALAQQRLIALAPKSVRWTARENLHLTLVFIGEIDAATCAAIQPVLADVAKAYEPLSLTIGGLGVFPNWREPRVLWMGVREQSGQLMTLQQALAVALQPFGVKEDSRPYHPHLTLGYVRDGDDEHAAQDTLQALRPMQLGEIAQAHANALTFFESRKIRPRGEMRYFPLAQFVLQAQSA